MIGTGHGGENRCSTRLIINWLGVLAVLALGAAVGLSVHDRNDATTIVTIVGISASVASGLIGYLGGRAAQSSQTINTERATVTAGGGTPAASSVETQNVTTAPVAPAHEDGA